MTPHRSASAILYCLALSTLAVIIGFAFLRAATRQKMSGRTEMLVALAQDAAHSGLAHATEQIMVDYTTSSLTIADNVGAKVVSPPTFLDGPYRAPFVSLNQPNRLTNSQVGLPAEADDVPEENNLLSPFVRKVGERDMASWRDSFGTEIYDGRGRYIEVAYHNVTRPSPVSPTPEPVAPVRFSDPAPAAPERADGLFLDENLHRITSGSALANRQNARFRVRYAVGVSDLEGHLLSNPIGNMNDDWTSPANDYRQQAPWFETAANAWYNMTGCYVADYATAPLRMEHVFRGRGSSQNTDKKATGPRKGLPATFPMMFRNAVNGYWSAFTYKGATLGVSPFGDYAGRLYEYKPPHSAAWADIAANPNGGEIITPIDYDYRLPYTFAHIGPQVSWYNQYFSMVGYARPGNNSGGDGQGYGLEWSEKRSLQLTIPTPFGRRLELSDAPPANWKWYQGRVNTPWKINVLTAAPQIISQMLLAYAPPHLKTLHYNRDDYYAKTGVDAFGFDIFNPAVDHSSVIDVNVSFPGRDIMTDLLTSGMSEFPAPSSLFPAGVGPTVVKPDYNQDLPEPRPVADRYPGPLCRGDSANANEGSDNLGELIDVDSRAIGRCTHTGQPLLYLFGGDILWYQDPIGGNPKYRVWRRIDTTKYTYKYSYYWDMIKAMTTAISYTRATWVQYPNAFFDPRAGSPDTGFVPATLRDPLAHDTIEELDRLFLRQMGENFDTPGTPCPDRPILVGENANKFITFSIDTNPVSNTIKSLVIGDLIKGGAGATSIERGKVMERMLNDFRMSFLGASPDYSEAFQPLDFDGDGKIMCSCFDLNPPPANAFRTNRWVAADPSGRAPLPLAKHSIFDPAVGDAPWFCATGCFFIGKSHFYRIFTRGEVYDTLLEKVVSAQTLESVLAVDPEAPRIKPPGSIPVQSRTLFQRWHYNDSTTELPRQLR